MNVSVTRVFFITDIHGSDLCFRKFLAAAHSAKKADVLIIGGDITAKWLVPLVDVRGGRRRVSFSGEDRTLLTEREICDCERHLADVGAYSIRCDSEFASRLDADPSLVESTLERLRIERLQRWVEWTDSKFANSTKRIFINAGNDDPFYVDPVLESSSTITRPEGSVIEIAPGVVMISTGFVNRTPWDCPRDITDEQLEIRIMEMLRNVADPQRSIFNFHAPPYGTSLDLATALNTELRPEMSLGASDAHVGSHAVRRALDEYQPLVGLHGHIHEQHAYTLVGRTICFNPGSEYDRGLLRGVYLELDGGILRRYGLTREQGIRA